MAVTVASEYWLLEVAEAVCRQRSGVPAVPLGETALLVIWKLPLFSAHRGLWTVSAVPSAFMKVSEALDISLVSSRLSKLEKGCPAVNGTAPFCTALGLG